MDDINDKQEYSDSIKRLTRDLIKASATLSDQEVRCLVDGYYLMQDGRKRANSQVMAMAGEPTQVLSWLGEQSEVLEGQIKRALQSYAQSQKIGQWMLSIYGIGPVITAGMLAHIDLAQAPTAGHIWRYAGLDPTQKWGKGQKRVGSAVAAIDDLVDAIATLGGAARQ